MMSTRSTSNSTKRKSNTEDRETVRSKRQRFADQPMDATESGAEEMKHGEVLYPPEQTMANENDDSEIETRTGDQVPLTQVPSNNEEIQSFQATLRQIHDDLANHMQSELTAITTSLTSFQDEITAQMSNFLREQQRQAPPLPERAVTVVTPHATRPEELVRALKVAAAETRQRLRWGTMLLSAISAKIQNHPSALLGAILATKSNNQVDGWAQVTEYNTGTQQYTVQEAGDHNSPITHLTMLEMAQLAVLTTDQVTQVAATTHHQIPLPERLVSVRTRYETTEMCTYLDLLVFSSKQTQHSFRLTNDLLGDQEFESDRTKTTNKQAKFSESVWSRIGTPQATVKTYKGKELARRLSYPVHQMEDGSSGQFGGAGRYTAMTQDTGELLATTFGCHDIMHCRTVPAAEANIAASTKHAPSIADEQYTTEEAIDAFRNYVSAIEIVFHPKADFKARLEALPDELVRFIRANEAIEPGLHTRQFARKYCNALLQRLMCFMPCLTVTDEDMKNLLHSMVVTHDSPFYKQI